MITVNCQACGNEFKTYPSAVARGAGKYCSVHCRAISGAVKHGGSRSRLYSIWSGMKARCTNPKSPKFEYYGGRGIAVCNEWMESFEYFRRWAMSSGYSDSLTLDRKDVNEGYGPSNCRWATRLQQIVNTRKRANAETSRFKGVSWCAHVRKWRAQIHRSGRTIQIGLFDREEAAAAAYDREALKVFGEFARLNFSAHGGVPS